MADPRLIRICDAAQLSEAGSGVRFEVVEPGGTRLQAFAVRHRGRAFAYLNRCAHLGVELDWVEGRFFDADGAWIICAAHGALYDPASGACVGGACAGRGRLMPVPLVEQDGAVYRYSGPAGEGE